MSQPEKYHARLYNVANEGVAFAIEEETGKTVFIPRQLAVASGIEEEDVGRYVSGLTIDGSKGPQAITLDFDDEPKGNILAEILERLQVIEDHVGVSDE